MEGTRTYGDKYLLCIAGPTGVGKTTIAIELARHFKTEIISADSRQLYKEMEIGTAKPSKSQLSEVPHHMVNSISITSEFSTGHYEREVIPLIRKLHQKYNLVILAGGTGLYFKAIIEGLDDFPEVDKEIKIQLKREYSSEGLHGLQMQMKELDPDYFKMVDQDNPHRLIRALSVTLSSGIPFSTFLNRSLKNRPFKVIPVFLNRGREELYERINRRVTHMMDEGLLDEVKSLYPHKSLPALRTVGYQELFDYMDGNATLEEAIALIQRNSRRYAKRQITWYRNQGQWQEFSAEDLEGIISLVETTVNG